MLSCEGRCGICQPLEEAHASDWVIWGETLARLSGGSVVKIRHRGKKAPVVTLVDVGADVPGGGAC